MSWVVLEAICIPSLIISVLAALLLIVLVMLQKSNSNGVSALGGQQETFYGKNKGKTLENKLRKLTIIVSIIMAVFMILFAVVLFHSNF